MCSTALFESFDTRIVCACIALDNAVLYQSWEGGGGIKTDVDSATGTVIGLLCHQRQLLVWWPWHPGRLPLAETETDPV